MKSLVKILSLKICLLAVLVFVCAPTGTDSLFVFSPVAFAASDPVMMYGKTTPILTNGINNAGNIWFQNDGATVYLANDVNQQPKLIPDPSNPGGYKIEGWAWSDNLGWVSFSCRGGKNPPSTGAACGAFDYGVTIDAAGVFHGYAWNDAMGYINMNSETYNPPALDGLGKPIVHAVKMTTTGAVSGYAWSQSLGWLNFGGVYADLRITVAPNTNCATGNYVGVCGSVGPDPSNLNFDSFFKKVDPSLATGVRVADGVDAYTISLSFKDMDGNIIPKADFDSNKYEAKVIFKWTDTVKRNQIVAATGSDFGKVSSPFKTVGGAGVVLYKPVFIYTNDDSFVVSKDIDEALYGAKESGFSWSGNSPQFKITSLAPTTDGNLSRIVGTSKGFVENEDFSMFDNKPVTGLEKNKLVLNSIEWAVKNTVTGQTIHGTSGFTADNSTLKFKPALTVATLNGENDENTLWMYRNVPVGVDVGTENWKTNLMDGTIKENYNTTLVKLNVNQSSEGKFNTSFTGDTKIWMDGVNDKAGFPEIAMDKSIKTLFSTFTTQQGTLRLEALIPNLQDLPSNYSEGAGLYSVMEYLAFVSNFPSLKITYFSNHLPRTISTGVSNPSVVIMGTTYSQGSDVTSVQSGVNITGIGDQNVNIVRDLVYENIQKLLIDKVPPSHVNGKVDLPDLTPNSCGTGCLLIELDNERIFYFRANNVVLKGAGDLYVPDQNPKNTVVVVDGGDLHIEGNLYTDVKEKKNYKIGLIVFREKDLDEGNIYVGSNVTNIQALMIADGTLFSAPNYPFGTDKFGEPDPIDPLTFNKQLVIEGGVSSRNCIGCVDNAEKFYNIPTHGLLSSTDPATNEANKNIAKKYDLNYLRYFGLGLVTNNDGEYFDLQCKQTLANEQLESPPQGCDIDPTTTYKLGGDLAITDKLNIAEGIKTETITIENQEITVTETSNPVYIKYVPPSSDSYVFSKEKNLTF